jgi:hypothetical protein
MTDRSSSKVVNYADFASRLERRQDRWSLLREVMDEWSIQPQSDTYPELLEMLTPESIAAAELRLGFELPTALKEWYALPFRYHGIWGSPGSNLLSPVFEEDGSYLRLEDGFIQFHTDDHGCCVWGFRAEDAALPDPPVYNGMDLNSVPQSGAITWVPQNRSLSEWALDRTIEDGLMIGREYLSTEVTPVEASRLLRGFRPMGFPTQPWCQRALVGGPNAIARIWPSAEGAWDCVTAVGKYPTVVSRGDWDQLWASALARGLRIVLYCRDGTTLDQILMLPGANWELNTGADNGQATGNGH